MVKNKAEYFTDFAYCRFFLERSPCDKQGFTVSAFVVRKLLRVRKPTSLYLFNFWSWLESSKTQDISSTCANECNWIIQCHLKTSLGHWEIICGRLSPPEPNGCDHQWVTTVTNTDKQHAVKFYGPHAVGHTTGSDRLGLGLAFCERHVRCASTQL